MRKWYVWDKKELDVVELKKDRLLRLKKKKHWTKDWKKKNSVGF